LVIQERNQNLYAIANNIGVLVNLDRQNIYQLLHQAILGTLFIQLLTIFVGSGNGVKENN
jgi:hypothetical protein